MERFEKAVVGYFLGKIKYLCHVRRPSLKDSPDILLSIMLRHTLIENLCKKLLTVQL